MALVEACVETLDEALSAEAAGAARIELCENLEAQGTTPAAPLIQACTARLRVPVFVMVRPRPGPFTCTASELATMCAQVQDARALGASGIVTGVLTESGAVDTSSMAALVRVAGPLPVTFHRAVDLVSDRDAALDALIGVGVTRVLTSGGSSTAAAGIGEIARAVSRAAGRLVVVAAGGIRAHNVAALIAATGVSEVHAHLASAEEVAGLVRAASHETSSPSAP